MVKSNILPKPITGNYDLAGCIRAYEKYLQQQNPSKSNNNLHTQKLRLLKAQADKAELEVQILEEKYIAVSEVELTWSNLLLAFRARMLGLPFYHAIKKPISSGFISGYFVRDAETSSA